MRGGGVGSLHRSWEIDTEIRMATDEFPVYSRDEGPENKSGVELSCEPTSMEYGVPRLNSVRLGT